MALIFCPVLASGRIPIDPAQVSIPDLSKQATLIFRGGVSNINMEAKPRMSGAIATFTVDRWYKGSGPSQVPLSFSYFWQEAVNGHDCIAFKPGTYWIIFATGRRVLKLSDDCYGALSVSRRLADNCTEKGTPACMIADFVAGLDDDELDGRIASIQRLGNLNSRDALPALHSELDRSSGKEYEWAVYATLGSGDSSVLPKVEELLQVNSVRTLPEGFMYYEIGQIRDVSAVANLLSVLEHVPMAAGECIIALGNIGSPNAAFAIAPYLSDPDQGVRYQALDAMRKVTKSSACTFSPDSDTDSEEARYLAWWLGTRSGSVSQ